MPELLSLCTEILLEITDKTTKTDRKSLRAACSRLRDVVDPQLFSHLEVDVYRMNQTNGIALLEGLANASPVSQYVRSLKINPCKMYQGEYGFYRTESAKIGINALHSLQRTLVPAISSLRSLRQVKWYITLTDLLWSREAIFNALASLEHLSDVSLVITGDQSLYSSQPPHLFPLQRLQNLERFSIAAPMPLENIWAPARQLIAQCPDLRCLVLRNTHWHSYDATTGAHLALADILKSSPSHLTELHVDGCQITPALAEACRDQLKSLTVLRVDECHSGTRGTDIWSILASENVFVSSLDVSVPTLSLMTYLSSHPGLETLRLGGGYDFIDGFDGAPEMLFRTVLPYHHHSLTQLIVSPTTGTASHSEWYFSETQATAISKCRNLTSLTIYFPRGRSTGPALTTAIEGQDNPERMKLIMITISRLPLLSTLEIIFPEQCCCCITNYLPIIDGATSFGPIQPGTFNPLLEIIVDRDLFRLIYTPSNDIKGGKFEFWSARVPNLMRYRPLSTPSITLSVPSESNPRRRKLLGKLQAVTRNLKRKVLGKLKL